ncbi:MAG: hypothetical protein ACHQZS_00855 [Candidatus Binatales bacterium]
MRAAAAARRWKKGAHMDFREIVRTVELENLWELICMWQSIARDDLTVMHCHFFRLLWAAD